MMVAAPRNEPWEERALTVPGAGVNQHAPRDLTS